MANPANEEPMFRYYPYTSLPDEKHIQLLQIEPLRRGEDFSALVRCSMRSESPCSRRLLPSEAWNAPPERPKVQWDEYVTSRPAEIFQVIDEDLVEPMIPTGQKPGLSKRAMAKLAGRPSRESWQQALEGAKPMNGAIFQLMPPTSSTIPISAAECRLAWAR